MCVEDKERPLCLVCMAILRFLIFQADINTSSRFGPPRTDLGWQALNSRGSYILTTPALVEVKFTPRSWDTGTQPQHCIQNQTQHFPLATLFHQPCKPQQMLHSLPGVPLLFFRKDKNCKKKKTRLKPP